MIKTLNFSKLWKNIPNSKTWKNFKFFKTLKNISNSNNYLKGVKMWIWAPKRGKKCGGFSAQNAIFYNFYRWVGKITLFEGHVVTGKNFYMIFSNFTLRGLENKNICNFGLFWGRKRFFLHFFEAFTTKNGLKVLFLGANLCTGLLECQSVLKARKIKKISKKF